MISAESRQLALNLVKEAVESGARYACACEILGITERTLRRWKELLKEAVFVSKDVRYFSRCLR
ncbi:MAG: helix-turn-helix domain-containing protein [Gammaproteobacteria bacterium]|nr:helix-turn-helix domain-containing protein [Gammaproteobacteria bacterium]